MKAITIIALSLVVSPALYAGDSGMFKDYYRSDIGEYNQYKVKGYDIQPPVPAGWYYRGCRQGDYNCMYRYGRKRVYHDAPDPDLVRDIR